MNTLQVLIVDDERLSRRRLTRFLSHDSELAIAAECTDGRQASEFLSDKSVDIVLLDIQMPGMDGFAFINSLTAEQAAVRIFVTAYDQFALRAFEVHAFDYLLKPYEEKRLSECLTRAKSHLRTQRPASSVAHALPEPFTPPARQRDRLAVRAGEGLILLRTDQVDWIEAADNYVYLHCGTETHTLRETMNSLQRTLDAQKFLRIHRSAIVNLDRVKSLQPWFRGDYRVVLSTGAQLTLSRSYRQNLQDRIMNF